MIRRMLKEEWRMHSRIFRGETFALFPVMIFLLSFFLTWLTLRYSTLEAPDLSGGLLVFGAFMGASVGSIAFTSRSAMKNILGPTNLLVYSSRTLPVSDLQLITAFLVKDLLYYTIFFLLPISLGVLLPSSFQLLGGVIGMNVAFFLSLTVAVAVARTSLSIPSAVRTNYGSGFLSPLAQKSLTDLFRSSGGITKVFFTFGVLTGFYWFLVLNFPATSLFLQNPLLSFSVLLGTLSLSVYNWLNRFDSVEDYLYLPLDMDRVLDAKQQAFLAVAVPVSLIFLALAYYFYPSGMLLLSAATSIATAVYTMGIASYLTGTEPNYRLYSTPVFLKYLAANSVIVVPLLVLSVLFTGNRHVYITFMFAGTLLGALISREARLSPRSS